MKIKIVGLPRLVSLGIFDGTTVREGLCTLQQLHVQASISTVREAIVRAGKCKSMKPGADKFAFY